MNCPNCSWQTDIDLVWCTGCDLDICRACYILHNEELDADMPAPAFYLVARSQGNGMIAEGDTFNDLGQAREHAATVRADTGNPDVWVYAAGEVSEAMREAYMDGSHDIITTPSAARQLPDLHHTPASLRGVERTPPAPLVHYPPTHTPPANRKEG